MSSNISTQVKEKEGLRSLKDKEADIVEGKSFDYIAPPEEAVDRVYEALSEHIEHYAPGKLFRPPATLVFSPLAIEFQPDIVYLSAQNETSSLLNNIYGAPDLIVEFVTAETYRLDYGVKRETYRSFEVPELWYFDMDAGRVEVFSFSGDKYRLHSQAKGNETAVSVIFPRFRIIPTVLLPARQKPD